MKENKLPYTHLMYVTKYSIFTNKYELYIIGVNTDDIYHTMGEYLFRSEARVEKITFAESTQFRLDYWKENEYKIYEFRDKYPYSRGR
jgi:hypothetical protein